jgi:leader peptidase (prepilin peptidase) / N-methyltransferase
LEIFQGKIMTELALMVPVFILGICLGSFFNVIIYRMPLGLSVVHPPSSCPKCGKRIQWYDNFPIFSWILLRFRCRHCKIPISAIYPFVELLTGVLSVLAFIFMLNQPGGFDWAGFASLWVFVLASIPIIVIDFKHFLIPDMIVFPSALLIWIFSWFHHGISPLESLIGGLGSALLLWFFRAVMSRILGKEAMGLGDVKLFLMLGALNGIRFFVLNLVLSSILGLIYFFIRRIFSKTDSVIPFGPFLLFGALISYLIGDFILLWYWEWVGL